MTLHQLGHRPGRQAQCNQPGVALVRVLALVIEVRRHDGCQADHSVAVPVFTPVVMIPTVRHGHGHGLRQPPAPGQNGAGLRRAQPQLGANTHVQRLARKAVLVRRLLEHAGHRVGTQGAQGQQTQFVQQAAQVDPVMLHRAVQRMGKWYGERRRAHGPEPERLRVEARAAPGIERPAEHDPQGKVLHQIEPQHAADGVRHAGNGPPAGEVGGVGETHETGREARVHLDHRCQLTQAKIIALQVLQQAPGHHGQRRQRLELAQAYCGIRVGHGGSSIHGLLRVRLIGQGW